MMDAMRQKERNLEWLDVLGVALRYVTLRYVTLRYVTLRYVTLRYVTLRYVTLYVTSCRLFLTLQVLGKAHVRQDSQLRGKAIATEGLLRLVVNVVTCP